MGSAVRTQRSESEANFFSHISLYSGRGKTAVKEVDSNANAAFHFDWAVFRNLSCVGGHWLLGARPTVPMTCIGVGWRRLTTRHMGMPGDSGGKEAMNASKDLP